MTTERERVLSDFIDAWNAGRRPDVDAHLARVEDSERGALADEIASFLTWAPDPDYDDATLAAIAAKPIVREARQPDGLWPALMPRLRRRAGLTTAQLASRLAGVLGLPADAEPKAARYLGQLEQGSLDPAGLSRRLLEGLSRVLGVTTSTLEDAAAPLRPSGPSAIFRADEPAAEAVRDDLEILADALATGPIGDHDDVDVLFRGGR